MLDTVYLQYGNTKIRVGAGEPLLKNRVVALVGSSLFLASSSNLDHSNSLLGITVHSAEFNTKAQITLEGLAQDESWDWSSTNPVLLGLNGQLTQVAPITGFMKVVGKPISKTQIIFRPETSIILI